MFEVLIVDDTRLGRAMLGGMLRKLDIQVSEACDGPGALARYESQRPGLILLDVNMPGMDGYQVAREIRARYPDEWVPIIFLSAREEADDLREGIEAGGDDYLTKPVDPIVLRAKIIAMRRLEEMRDRLVAVTSDLAAANAKLEQLSQIDGLTGIANRRTFDLILERELGRCQRQSSPLSVILCDVDHFKLYNDTYGHPAGDQCLRCVAGTLQSGCRRKSDLVARYGGEEFAVILPDTDALGAITLANQLHHGIASLAMPHSTSPVAASVTLSMGVAATHCTAVTSAGALLEGADKALYQAKHQGRNRVHISADWAESLMLKVAA